MLRISKMQRIVLLISVLLVAVPILFPPWLYYHKVKTSQTEPAGHHFVNTPPSTSKVPSVVVKYADKPLRLLLLESEDHTNRLAERDEEIAISGRVFRVKIDHRLQRTEVGGAFLITVLLFLVVGGIPSNKSKSHVQEIGHIPNP
ncbi:MAG: hypothetical protein GY835_06440 [bacterium]|nr:hypothetical protein [bacterium]